jgi:membrane protein implicated in regulation of membrane protease activity
MFAGGLWMLLQHPLGFLIALAVFAVLAVTLIVLLWRFLRRLFRPRRESDDAVPAMAREGENLSPPSRTNGYDRSD